MHTHSHKDNITAMGGRHTDHVPYKALLGYDQEGDIYKWITEYSLFFLNNL